MSTAKFFLNSIPYPYPGVKFPEGPEDIRPEDNAVVTFHQPATPQHPRISEGDVVATAEGHLLIVYGDFYAGEGWDGSPARLVAKTSDGRRSNVGRTVGRGRPRRRLRRAT